MGKRRVAVVAAAVAVLAAAGLTIGVLTSGGTPFEKAPKPVLGQSLHPLKVFAVADRVTTLHPEARPGERVFPATTGIHPLIVNNKLVITLHVDYVRVIPSQDGWRMVLSAPEGAFFNGETMGTHRYVTLVEGKPIFLLPLFELNGPPITAADETQFVLGGWRQWSSQDDALRVARSLTTSVTIAQCTTEQVEKFRCS